MDVVVVGSCMTDLTCYAPELPKPGMTLQGHRFEIGFGGKGANQCVMASLLGAQTAMVAKLGTDVFGQNYLNNFKKLNINSDFVTTTSTASTGVASIAVDDQGQNSIIIVSGSNLELNVIDVDTAESIIRSAKVLLCQLEIQPEVTLRALQIARKHNVMTILNPAPAVRHLTDEYFHLADIFCPNETEASILTGLPVGNIEEAKVAVYALQNRGCKQVILTMGEQGCLMTSGEGENSTVIHISASLVKAVDTTGAGDAFVGSLACYLSTNSNISLVEAARKASFIAGVSVQSLGTQTSYPTLSTLLKMTDFA